MFITQLRLTAQSKGLATFRCCELWYIHTARSFFWLTQGRTSCIREPQQSTLGFAGDIILLTGLQR